MVVAQMGRSRVAAIADRCCRIADGESRFRRAPLLTVMVPCCAADALRHRRRPFAGGRNPGRFSGADYLRQPAGATSPATIAGASTQAVAETLGGLVFARYSLFSGGSIPLIIVVIGTLIKAPFKIEGSETFTMRNLSFTMFPSLLTPSPLRSSSAYPTTSKVTVALPQFASFGMGSGFTPSFLATSTLLCR